MLSASESNLLRSVFQFKKAASAVVRMYDFCGDGMFPFWKSIILYKIDMKSVQKSKLLYFIAVIFVGNIL